MAGQAYCIMKSCEERTVYKTIPCKKCRNGESISKADLAKHKKFWEDWARQNPNKVKAK